MPDKLSLDFNRFSRQDRFLLKLANSRDAMLKTFFSNVKEAPLVFAIFMLAPTPFSFVSISPFLVWFRFDPTKKMRHMRSTLSAHFNQDIRVDRFAHLIHETEEGMLKLRKRSLFAHMNKQDYNMARTMIKNRYNRLRKKA